MTLLGRSVYPRPTYRLRRAWRVASTRGRGVTEARLRAVEAGEAVIRAAGVEVVRCRVRTIDAANEAVVEAIVEVLDEVRGAVTAGLLADLARVMQAIEPSITRVSLDERPYRPGRAVLLVG